MDSPDILDFEASGFGPDSYPIEVGFSLASGERFCTLIKPHSSWQHWSADAQAVHGIERSILFDAGMTVDLVCIELNQRLRGLTLYTDAWVYDKAWLNKLFECAGCQPAFHLHAIENIQSECQHLIWDDAREKMLQDVNHIERHRASADAQFIQKLFIHTRTLCSTK
jgi:hypothetical protein